MRRESSRRQGEASCHLPDPDTSGELRLHLAAVRGGADPAVQEGIASCHHRTLLTGAVAVALIPFSAANEEPKINVVAKLAATMLRAEAAPPVCAILQFCGFGGLDRRCQKGTAGGDQQLAGAPDL